jgi:hypothetical protein
MADMMASGMAMPGGRCWPVLRDAVKFGQTRVLKIWQEKGQENWLSKSKSASQALGNRRT